MSNVLRDFKAILYEFSTFNASSSRHMLKLSDLLTFGKVVYNVSPVSILNLVSLLHAQIVFKFFL